MIKEAIGQGESVILAKENACRILGVEEKNVEIEVLQLPVKKTLGIFGGKPAKVRAFFEISPAEEAKKYLSDILKSIGVHNFTITEKKEERGVTLHVSGDKVNFAIGKRGDVLKSIQYLVSLVANSVSDGYFPVNVDIEDYRERRFKTLESLGKSLAFKAIKTLQVQQLEPMSTYERWIIHEAVKSIRGAKSWSEGEGSKRHIFVGPSDELLEERKNLNNKPFKKSFQGNKFSSKFNNN